MLLDLDAGEVRRPVIRITNELFDSPSVAHRFLVIATGSRRLWFARMPRYSADRRRGRSPTTVAMLVGFIAPSDRSQ